MSSPDFKLSYSVPWYFWPLAPIMFLGTFVVVGIPLGILALVAGPYYAIFPERHAHKWDFCSSPEQRERLALWRAQFQRIGIRGRCVRALEMRRRRLLRKKRLRASSAWMKHLRYTPAPRKVA